VGVNGREYRAAEIPAGNGHGNARALATIYGTLARGGALGSTTLLSSDAIARAAREVVSGTDAVLGMPSRRSLGFMLPVPGSGDPRGPAAFGHAGRGGSYGWADPERRVGFGYAMNQLWGGGPERPDPRADLLARAVYESLAG
jgi:CubicO group peptidase (beta-lactamase class C family)